MVGAGSAVFWRLISLVMSAVTVSGVERLSPTGGEDHGQPGGSPGPDSHGHPSIGEAMPR